MRLRNRRQRHREQVELNITAFMNLMVVLVPFLLVMAVFSRITIHELNLPSAQNAEQPEENTGLQLEVVVRADSIDLADKGRMLARVPNEAGEYNLKDLSEKLQKIKEQAPSVTAATVLLEPDIRYEHLVHVMDAVRIVQVERDGQRVPEELFPDISIGEVPKQEGGS